MIKDLQEIKLNNGNTVYLECSYMFDNKKLDVFTKDQFLNYSIIEKGFCWDWEIILGDTTEKLNDIDLSNIEILKEYFSTFFDELEKPKLNIHLAHEFFEYNDIESFIADDKLYIIINDLNIEVSKEEIDLRAEIASEY